MFGGFNNLYKITAQSISLWSRILKQFPQGCLLLKSGQFNSPSICSDILDKFESYGLTSSRIQLLCKTNSWNEHMALYDKLDIGLDPVGGVCGATTTCDALWMGVPVVTMAGVGMAKRISTSILASIGRTEWIAHNEDEYVDIALRLANDAVTRRNVRFNQRDKMLSSPLCDSEGLVRELESAYTKMYDSWYQSR